MTAPRKHTLELFTDRAGEWRWRRRAGNGEIISDSGEGYVDRRDAIHGMRLANVDADELRLIDEADALPTADTDSEKEETPDE